MNYKELANLVITMNQALLQLIKEIDDLRESLEASGQIAKKNHNDINENQEF